MAMKYDPIMCMMVDDSVKSKDVNTLYETFAHGNSKHAGVLEMNGKVKVVVWNEGDNPRTGKVTVIGEDTPANRTKAKSMLDFKTIDKAIRNCDFTNIKESIKRDIKSGKMTIKQAAIELYESGMFNYIPDESEVKRRLGI